MKLDAPLREELPDFQSWVLNSDGEITLLDYVGLVATPDLFFAFAELLEPETLVHDGARFLASGFDETIYDSWRRGGLDLAATQRVLNHVHVSTILQGQDVSPALALAVANTLARFWRHTLGESVIAEAGGTDLHDAYATFCDVAAGP